MNEVWVITRHEYRHSYIEKVFQDRENAEDWVEEKRPDHQGKTPELDKKDEDRTRYSLGSWSSLEITRQEVEDNE